MKIGMILDAPFPTDPRVSNEASALINAGHEVFLFCISFKKDFKRNDILNSIKVKRYYCSKLLYKFSALAYTFPFYKYFIPSCNGCICLIFIISNIWIIKTYICKF